MGQNPTLQVNALSRSQKMEMAMENIRQTHKLGNKPWIKCSKNPNSKFERNKVNVLMKLCLSKKKSATPKNQITKQATFDNINYNKQLEEIEILIDIIKKSGNVCKPESRTPMVHVPLPQEFYQLKPLVSFKSIGKKSKNESSNRLHNVTHHPAPGSTYKDLPTVQRSDLTKRVNRDLNSINKVESHIHEKLVVRKQDKLRIDKPTLTSSRVPPRHDKSASNSFEAGSEVRENSTSSGTGSSLYDSKPKTKIDRSTSTVEVAKFGIESNSLRIVRNDNLAVNNDLKSGDIVPTPQKQQQKIQETFQSSERGILREMSTISSNPYDNHLDTYPSFEIITFIEKQPKASDSDNLYLMDNSWTIIDSVMDPLQNAKQVQTKRSSRKANENKTVQSTAKESEKSLFKKETNSDSKLSVYVNESLNLSYTPEEDVATKSHDPQELESGLEKPKESDVKKVTYLDEIPELDLSKTKMYDEKQPEELSPFNVDSHNVDLELNQELKKMESHLLSVIDSNDKTLESRPEFPKEDQSKTHHKLESALVEPSLHSTEQHGAHQTKLDRRGRTKSKSRKRSKRRLPDVQLSDYKGFYVVHTTNDWSIS